MKKLLSIMATLLLISNISFAQVKWSVDPAHTNVRFEVNHLGISFVDGEFTKLDGNIETKDSTSFENAKVEFEIDVNSINTRVEARDQHLKSDDFFSAEKFPKMTLKNATLKKSGKGKYKLAGELTIKGVTKPVSFNVIQNNGIITDPWSKTRAGFTASTVINRFDYNISYDDKLPSGVPAVAADIEITVNVEVVKN